MLQNFLEKDLDHTDYLQVIKKGEKDFISNLCIAIFMFIAKKIIFFIWYFAVPWLILDNCWWGSLTNPMLMTTLNCIFHSKVTKSPVKRLGF